jgi:hypothetical protein
VPVAKRLLFRRALLVALEVEREDIANFCDESIFSKPGSLDGESHAVADVDGCARDRDAKGTFAGSRNYDIANLEVENRKGESGAFGFELCLPALQFVLEMLPSLPSRAKWPFVAEPYCPSILAENSFGLHARACGTEYAISAPFSMP